MGRAAEGALARRLDAEPGDPLLASSGASARGGAPVERVVCRYRGDRYEVHM